MAALQVTPTAPNQRTIDHDRHTRPLDSLLQALGEAECGTCQALLTMIKAHLEISVPAWPKGGAR